MNNIFDIFKMISNPKEFVMNFAKQNPSPMLDNLIKMAEGNNKKGVENVARNIFNEKGENFDDIMSNFK